MLSELSETVGECWGAGFSQSTKQGWTDCVVKNDTSVTIGHTTYSPVIVVQRKLSPDNKIMSKRYYALNAGLIRAEGYTEYSTSTGTIVLKEYSIKR